MASFYARSRPTATRSASHAYILGDKIVSTSTTQFLGICFECTTAGNSAGGGEPAWNTTVGGTTTDGGVTWTTRGAAGIWQASKTWVAGDRVCKVGNSTNTLNSASSCVWECTTGGAGGGSEPAWPTTITAGTTTQTDGSATWTARACTTWDNANPFVNALVKDSSNSTIKVSAGDTVYMSKTHSESVSPAAFTYYTFNPGGAAKNNPIRFISSDDTGQSQPPTTATAGAKIHINAATADNAVIGGVNYWYGVTFDADLPVGPFYNSSAAQTFTINAFDTCTFTETSTAGSSGQFLFGQQSSNSGNPIRTRLINCTLNFNNASQLFKLGSGLFEMVGGSFAGTLPISGTIDIAQGNAFGSALFDGVDFTAIGAHPLFTQNAYLGTMRINVARCKFAASASLVNAITVSNEGWGTTVVDAIGNDFGAGTNYKLHREHGCGTIDQETTKIRSSGASDGTTGISHKMVSNANASWHAPLEGFDLIAWNDNSGSSKTATVEILTDSLTALNNDDIWMELEYLPNSGDTQGSTVNDTKATVLTANAAQPTSTATWTTTGITNVMKQKLQITFTPGQKGAVRARVFLGKTSATVYVDPMMSIA